MPEQNNAANAVKETIGKACTDSSTEANGEQSEPTPTVNLKVKQNEQEYTRLAKEVKSGEKWLIGIGILTIAVNSFIGYLYWQQLKEMVGVAGQSDSLTRSYRNQARDIQILAKQTHDLAVSSRAQSISTQKVAESTKAESTATSNIALSTAGQLETMQTQMELTERPRVSILVSAGGNLTFTKAYPQDKVTVPLTFTYHNAGPTPALVIVRYHRLATNVHQYMAGSKNQEGQAKSVRDVCLEHTDIYKTFEEVLPGTDLVRIAPVEGYIDPSRVGQISAWLTTCISYRSNFGKKIYHSEIGYALSARGDGELGVGRNIDENALRFEEIPGTKHADDDEK